MAHYFVHQPPDGSPALFRRSPGDFAGITFHHNRNLSRMPWATFPPSPVGLSSS